MKRRCFLGSTIAASICTTMQVGRAAAETGAVTAALIITDISANTDPASLGHVVEALLVKGISVTCALRLAETTEDEAKLSRLLTALAGDGYGADLAVEIPGLCNLSPYFQARAVFEARRRLGRTLGVSPASTPVRSILCNEIEDPTEPLGVRASGLRNVLVRPNADTVVRSETWDNGVVRFLGGTWIGPHAEFSTLGSEAGKEGKLLFYLSADSLSQLAQSSLDAWIAHFCETVLALELTGQFAMMTASDLQLRDDFGEKRFATVVLELPGNAGSTERRSIADFRSELTKAKIPYALKGEGDVYWVSRNGRDAELVPIVIEPGYEGPSRIASADGLSRGFAIRFSEAENQDFGIDDCAVLRLPVLRVSSGLFDGDAARVLSGGQDVVVCLSADQLSSVEARRRSLADLQTLGQDGITKYVSAETLAAALCTDEPAAIRHRLTRAAMARPAPQPAMGIDGAERAGLQEDARLAWSYFEKFTERATGLCPATVDTRPDGQALRAVTMWDVASNLNAIVAAAEIGLIDREDAEGRFGQIFPNIIGRETDDRRLPQGWIRTDRHRWGISDFDGSDGGRLLSSLDNIRRRFGMDDAVSELVRSWDLEKIVIDRQIHSVTKGELSSIFWSHCGHYAALAFRRWGFDVASPYETFKDRGSGDGEMALLDVISRIGPLGAEPLLLEAMELGMSQESGYLAEVLLTAMEEEHAETGRLLCPSETPIERPPWFIYQGLDLGTGPRSWRLDTVGQQPEYMTEKAARTFLTFSTKAAYLWAAHRPCAFTRKLVDHARETAKGTDGFVSGVNMQTGRPTSGYFDLNTNGVILQAISHILRTRV